MNGMRTGSLRNLVLLAFSVILTLAAVEAALRVADFPRQPMKPDKIKDPILAYKIPPTWPGVDADGYRNPGIPDQVDIVALGDSHTYGLNADIDTNWPGQLAKMTGLSVYNLGIGGYGPLQYYYLFDRALQFKPQYIVIGLYLPNDIKGLCHPYLRSEYWKTRAAQEKLDLGYCGKAEFPDDEGDKGKRAGMLQKAGGLIVNSKLGVLISITARRLRVLKDSMDMKQPEIASSLEVTKMLISRMAERSRENGVKLVVMVIPSKEYVYHQYLHDAGKPLPEILAQMAMNESGLRSNVIGWLAQQSIPHVDAASTVLEAVKSRGGIYSHDNDDHPLPAGYAAYAQALHEGFFVTPKH